MKKIILLAAALLCGWPAWGQNFSNYPGFSARFIKLPPADAGSTGDVSGMSVTSSGTTQTLGAWFPTFAKFGVPNNAAQFFAGYASIGRPTSDPGSIWVNNDNLLGSFVPGQVKQFVISDNGGYSALVTANRTSDQPSTTTQSVLSDTCLSVNDNTVTAHMNWCRYTHSSLKAGSKISLSLGEENSLENLSSFSVAVDPFSDMGPGSGVTAPLRLTSGIGRPANDVSSYFQMINNGGARALSGIVFSWDAFNMSSGYASAMSMGPSQGLTWWNGLANRGWRIFANGNQGSGSIVMGNNVVDIYAGNGGANPLRATTGGILVQGTLQTQGPVQLTSYTAGTLPACTGDALRGSLAVITDAPSGYTYRQAVAGGGTTRAPVFCTGGQWEFH